jgi:release factor glutamine methyltransferase
LRSGAVVSIHTRVAEGRERLRQVGIAREEADLDARLLAEFLLGWDAARFFTADHGPEPSDFDAPYRALIDRRARREPLAYITGRREFWGLAFEVSPAVLIPRPETELIVESALERFPDRAAPLLIADVCTGSGCLAVVLACERPHARLVATDVSADALGVARGNAARHAVADRIQFVETDLLNGSQDCFDLIVSNPPYVPERDLATLPPEVRDYEPAVALFAKDDGLAVIRRVVEQSVARLRRGAVLVFELGFGQADAVSELISATRGLTMVDLRRDLQGIGRTAIARRTS